MSPRVALVTGGGTGIGRATALALYEAGWSVTVSGRRADVLEQVVTGFGERGLAVAGDVASEEDCRSMVDDTVARFGQLDLLVNNAALFWVKPFLDEEESGWRHQFDVNLNGPWYLCRHAHPHLKATKGSVINVLSTLAHNAGASLSTYACSKAALEMLGRCLALEWAADGIRVNAVSPGVVETPIHPPGVAESMAASHPLGRIGQPEEVAAAILFLASEASGWTTGANLDVDGGIRIA